MQGIKFFEKNKIDLDAGDNVVITVTDATATDDGQDYVDYMRNRNNISGWATTGSNDAANTTLIIDFETATINTIFLVRHNLKAYTIKYWNGSSYVNFSTTIAETTNTDETTIHTFDEVGTNSIEIVITGTIGANDDKFIRQIILTESIGQFSTIWSIDKPELSRTRKTQKSISGKGRVVKNLGAFSCKLIQKNAVSDNDLDIVESLFNQTNFLVWLCGGDPDQFRTQRYGYRLEDIFLMTCENEYSPEWADGQYNQGNNIDIELIEAI